MSDEDKVIQKKWDTKNLPKTFMGPAYVLEKEPGTYAMYRNVEIEENGVREKFGKPIGPLFLFRVAGEKENEDFITSKPDGTVIRLKRTWPEIPDELPADFKAK